jgi:hypothetical protein
MSIQAPQGILNIPNAILRVGKLSVDEVVGADTILNTVARNTILLVDDEAYHENKNWSLKLPNAWAGEFECNTASAGNYSEFNFYNEGASSNTQGYNLTFNDTAVELRYDGTLLTSGTLASTITGTGVKKVRLMFERTILSVTVDGTLVFTHDDTGGPRPRVYSTTAGGFLNFFTNGGALKNLKIVNEKWISDGTSNIAYVGGGEVAVGQALAFNRVSNVSQIKVDANVVTEYTGPHDRPLRKYPEVAMTANDNSSTSGYVVDKSEESSSGDAYAAYRAFDGIIPDGTTTIGWRTDSGYNQDTGLADGGVTRFTGDSGEWVELQLPNSIKLSSIVLKVGNQGNNLANSQRRFPKVFVIYGYNGTSWDRIQEYTTSAIQSLTDVQTFHISNPTAYHNKFVLVVKQTYSVTGATSGVTNIGELEYYGHEEGSGSLDTTLKSVYNVPATTGTQLEVYYDAKDLTEMPSIVTDLAGGDQNGTVTGHSPTLDETNGIESFKFDGVDDYITTTLTNPNTDWVHSVSMWVYPIDVSVDSVNGYMFAIGAEVSNQVSALRFSPDGFQYTRWAGGGARNFNGPVTSGRWHHVTLVSPGSTDVQVYLDGRLLGYTSDSLAALTLPQNTSLSVGRFAASVSYSRPFEGSIANFRLYSKALNADQIKELYEYQKDYFLGSKSQVTLYKGHLGVGVTEPSGQLELAGDERIQEYPPGPMDDYETLIPGHGVFCASASDEYDTNGTFSPWKAFSKNTTSYFITDGNPASYNIDGTPTADAGTFEGVSGSWLKLKLPYDILLRRINIARRFDYAQHFSTALLYGSVDDVSWDVLHNIQMPTAYTNVDFEINATKVYKYFVVQITKGGGLTYQNIGEWKLFGTPGPTTLDKGSLSLTRSLDVPRISRYDVDTETPRPEKLVVDFDTTVNSSPTDISGKGNHGAFNGTNMNYSSADKAFAFNGTDDYIVSNPKLYNVALEPSEVKKLYNLGRTGRSMVISDTAVGIGKVPEAQLDVRGVANFGSRVGIGTTDPACPFHVKFSTDAARNSGNRFEDASSTNYWENWINSLDYFYFAYNGSDRGWIQGPGGPAATKMPNFTGQHMTFIKDIPFTRATECEGLIVSSDQNKYIKMNEGIENGSNAITINECLPVVSLSNVTNDKKCFGVISASEDPETRTVLYGAWGSVAEKEKGDTRVYINSVGEGAIWVTNINGSLESGDYITTSNVAGYGQKQDGAGLMNYTVAKITMDCDFNPETQPIQIIKRDETGENILDEHGQIQWEDHPTETEKAYKIRYLDANGNITDEANHVYKAAFVGCTYHCG